MPPFYYYSMGEVFRTGTSGNFKPTVLLIAAYSAAGFAAYVHLGSGVLALCLPVFWVMLISNIVRLRHEKHTEDIGESAGH